MKKSTIERLIDLVLKENKNKKYKAIQHKPIPKKTGNVLIDTLNEINSHMVFKGLRYPAEKNAFTKKGAKHNRPSKIRSACQLRASRLAMA